MPENDAKTSSDESERQLRFDEVLAELMRAIDAGEELDQDEWITKHPDFAADITEFFQDREQMEELVHPLRLAATHALHVRCPHCHNPIELLEEAELTDISCPSCGSSFSLVGKKTVSHYPAGEKMIEHFQLLDRVGVGAFGSVWKAKDTKLDRTVAVKIPRNGQLDELQTELFLRDARAAAQLKHSNIVSVHEVGKQDGTLYIVSDFIQGATLKEWLDAKQLTPRESAELCVKIAKALHHAHESGVIHRDLKPSNIMMDTDGEPHIVDFGLAKREAGEITMTVEGQILGTPAYMSPEQARGEGHTVDRRADIYSLGVILFELLTGELPFRGDKQMLIVQILKDDPPGPRKLNSRVPRDFDTICLKCMEKETGNRYATAGQVADELANWLAGKAIIARPASSAERIVKWAKRKPAMAGLIGVSVSAVVLLISGLLVSNILISGALRDRNQALHRLGIQEEQTSRALADRTKAYDELQVEQQRTNAAFQRETKALAKLTDANNELKSQSQELEVRQLNLYRSMIKLAHAQALGNNVALADKNLESVPEELRGWEWRYAKRLCHPDVLTTAGQSSVAFTADGKHVVACVKNRVQLIAVPSGNVVRTFRDHTADVRIVTMSSDGKQLASVAADNTITIWHAKSGEQLATVESPSRVNDLSFSPDHGHFAAACEDSTVRVWRTETGEVIHALSGQIDSVVCVAFSPDGKSVFSGTSPKPSLKVWDVTNGAERSEFKGLINWSAGLDGEDNAGVNAIVFSPDTKLIAIANADLVRLIDSTSHEELKTLAGHVGGIRAVAFSPDGRRVATGSSDGTVKIWDVGTGRSLRTLPWHEEVVRSVEFSPDGRWLASASDTEVKLWDLSPNWEVTTLPIHTDAVYALAFSRAGNWLATGGGRYSRGKNPPPGTNGEVRVVDLKTNQVAFSKDMSFNTRFGVLAVALSGDGDKVAAAGYIGTRVWDRKGGAELLHLSDERSAGEIWSIGFGPSDQLLFTSSVRTTTNVWDIATGDFVRKFGSRGYAQLSPAGDRLAVCKNDLAVWDWTQGQRLSTTQIGTKGRRRSGWRIAFSPDGKKIAACLDTRFIELADKDQFAQVFETKTGKLLHTLASQTKRDYDETDYISSVYGISFSPDGRRIATASGDKTVRIWDADTGDELLILDHPNQVFCVEFSPDGDRLVSGSGHWCGPRQGEIRIWDASTNEEMRK